jgi:hypothetical protein
LAARTTILLGLAVVMAVIAVGCGGGEETASGAPSLSSAEFVKQANAICRRERVGLSKKAAAWFAQDRRRGYPREVLNWRVAHYVLLPAVERESDEVLTLAANAPPADRPGIEAAVGAKQLAMGKVASAGRLASMKAFHRYFVESAVELQAIGLNACTND